MTIVTDNVPYLTRATAADSVLEMLNKIVGATVAWNQIVPTANKDFTSESSDTRALFFIFRKSSSPYTTLYQKLNVSVGILSSVVASSFDGYAQMIHSGSQRNIRITPVDGFQLKNGHKYLFSLNFTAVDTSTVGGVVAKDISVYDLTLAFGSTIADYIYNLEQNTAGAGVAFFRSIFGKNYYQYDAGTLQSVKTSAHVTKDGNGNVLGSYPIQNIDVRGLMELSDGKIVYDGDEYASNGTVTRKYGIRAYESGDESLADAITDGTNTVYKLTTPTTESASAFTQSQICDPNGSEEFIDGRDAEIPVGHSTDYIVVQ